MDRLVLTLDDQLVVFTQDGQVLRAAVPAKPEEAAAWTLRRDEIYIPKGQRGYALEGGDVAIAEEESNGEARAQWGRLANWESLPVASFARAEYSTRNAVTEGCRFEPIDPRTGRPDSYLDMSWRGGTFARVMRLDDRSNSNCVFRPYYCPTGVAVKDYRGQPLHQGSKNTTVLIDVPANRSGDVLPRALVLNNAPSRAADKTIVGIVRGALTSGNSCEWTVNSRNPEAPTSTQTTFEFWVSNHNPSCQSSFQANMIACTGAVRYHSYTFKSGLGECKQTSDPPACY